MSFREKTFDPFEGQSNQNLQSFDLYEHIRSACAFHSVNAIESIVDHKRNFNVMHVNIRSLLNKQDNLIELITHSKVKWNAISISETWLTQSLEENYELQGYTAFFCSRKNKIGGGSALYLKNELKPKLLLAPKFSEAEVICAEVFFEESAATICQIYRSPNSDKNNFVNELEDFLENICKTRKTVIVTGDFNYDLFSTNDSHVNNFFTTMCSYGFFPVISKTTRLTDKSSTLIDNIFCNNLSVVTNSGILLYDISDHFPIFACLKLNIVKCNQTEPLKTFNYRKLEDLRVFLSQELQGVDSENDPEKLANMITNAYNKGIDKFSYVKSSSRRTNARSPWVTPALLTSIVHKNELFEKNIKSPSAENKLIYNRYRNLLTRLLRNAKKNFYMDEIKKNRGNSKKTWNTLSTLMNSSKKTNPIPDQMNDGDNKLYNDACIAESFNKYFSQIGEQLNNAIPPSSFDPLHLIPNIENDMELPITNDAELIDIITNLNNVGAGADGINAKIFKSTYMSILPYLLHLFNICLETGVFPDIFKLAVIKPIFKGGDAQMQSNYRPISILPFLSKILEKLIYSRLLLHLNQNNLIHQNQFGFQKNKSTYMPLLLLQNEITNAFENGEYAIGLFLDLKKAFDTVNIEILLNKLAKYGIRHTSHKILSSYLSRRKQCVKIRNTSSSYANVTIGVPQGSILGPLLFLTYINDLPNINPRILCLSYADDTAIIFKHKQPEELQTMIDTNLELITKWFNANHLSLNLQKTYTQHYTTMLSEFKLNVNINNHVISEKEEIKYLGVTIDKYLKFSTHINRVSAIVSRNIGIIARNRYFIDSKSAYILYNTLVLPHLNYCCMIWGINYRSHLIKLITLQKRAVRLIDNIHLPQSSQPTFKRYKILRLEDIAKSQMLILMHKFLIKQLPEAFDSLYSIRQRQEHNTRQQSHLNQPFSNRNYRLSTSTCIGPRLWNDICAEMFPLISDIPNSKHIIKNIIRNHFIDLY